MAEDKPKYSEMHRRRRGKNLAVLAALVAFVVIIYFVFIVKQSGV